MLGTILFRHANQTPANDVEGHAAEFDGDVAADVLQLITRERHSSLDHFVDDDAIGADEDTENPRFRHRHKVDAADRELQQSGHEDHADLVRQMRHHSRGELQHGIDLVHMGHLVVDDMTLPVAQDTRLHQIFDEESVTAVCRHAASGGVRLSEIAEVFQIGHDVAEGCRRKVKESTLRQRARADGFATGYMLNDDFSQHVAGAAVELVAVDFELLYHRREQTSTRKDGVPDQLNGL